MVCLEFPLQGSKHCLLGRLEAGLVLHAHRTQFGLGIGNAAYGKSRLAGILELDAIKLLNLPQHEPSKPGDHSLGDVCVRVVFDGFHHDSGFLCHASKL